MKKIFLFSLTAFLFINSGCHAQYLMHSPQEAYKIQENEKRFINKPLDSLIAAIKPPIRMAMAEMTSNSPASGYFVFTFNTPAEWEALQPVFHSKDSSEVKIVVYLKEPFEWEPKEAGTGLEKLIWTKEDVKKYGHLTVIGIRVLGGKIYRRPII